jgi:5-formyltetrahydrofolate cyclo-ligase
MISEKQKLRITFKKKRDAIPKARQRLASQKIQKKLFSLLPVQQAKTIGLYLSKGSEVNTLPLVQSLLKKKKKIALPKVSKRSHQIHFHEIHSLQDCHLGLFDILEPNAKNKKVPIHQMDLIFVPGIAFDREGHRLGYGGGFYDRFLASAKKQLLIGLTYEKTFIPKIPTQKQDVQVHAIVTEKKVYWVNGLHKKSESVRLFQ